MATYTQTNRSVGTSQSNLFSSNIPFGSDWIMFADDEFYYCIYGDSSVNGDRITITDSTVMKLYRTTTNVTNNIITTEEANTLINVNYPNNVQSNIGVGVLTETKVETFTYSQIQSFCSVSVFVIALLLVGFSIIKKRWIV